MTKAAGRPGEENARIHAGAGGAARNGARWGLLVGVLFPFIDTLAISSLHEGSRDLSELADLAAASMVLSLPFFICVCAGCGLAFWTLGRRLPRACDLAVDLAFVVAAPFALVYGATERLEPAGEQMDALAGAFGRLLMILAAIGLISGVAGGLVVLRGIKGLRAKRLVPAACALALWILALAWILAPNRPPKTLVQAPSSGAARPNVLLIVLDAVRADHMSCYGYERKTTSHIDAFASASRVYRNVLSPGSWTGPSHASLFTGLPASAHGFSWLHLYLDGRFRTLAEQLEAVGYQTVCLSSNPHISVETGLARGFSFHRNFYEKRLRPTLVDLFRRYGYLPSFLSFPAARAMNRALYRWFDKEYQPDKPFFAFLNYIEPHQPYEPASTRLRWTSEGARRRWKPGKQYEAIFRHMLSRQDALSSREISELESLYDEEIACVDEQVGELLGFLEARRLGDRTFVAITSDHGEHFGEQHMMEHEYSVYEPLVRVPLIVKYDDRFPPGDDETLVQSHDLYPTILELAGAEWRREKAHNCQSLLDSRGDAPRAAIAEYLGPFLYALADLNTKMPQVDLSSFLQSIRAVQLGDLKLIRWSGGRRELYDLSADPREREDLAQNKENAETARNLERVLDEWLGSFDHYEAPVLTTGSLRQIPQGHLDALRGLGYIR
ncbi:MAG TPA: sulfatase [Sumerlaeia bacterium]|nr:sulfatase [Sumerlaeia bacterium]